jgi:hypothetical protein
LVGTKLKKMLVVYLALAIVIGLSVPVILSLNQPFQEIMYSMYLGEKKQLTVTKVSWDSVDANTVLVQAQSNYDRTFNITGVQLWYEDLTYGYEEKQLPEIFNVSSILRPGASVTLWVRVDRGVLQSGNYGVILQTDRMPYWSYPGLTVSSEFPAPEPSPREPTPTPYNANDVKITRVSWDTSRPKMLLIQVQSFSVNSFSIARVQFWHEGTTQNGHGGAWDDTIVNVTPTILSPFKTQTVTVNLEEGVLQPGEYKVCILLGNAMFWYFGFLEV